MKGKTGRLAAALALALGLSASAMGASISFSQGAPETDATETDSGWQTLACAHVPAYIGCDGTFLTTSSGEGIADAYLVVPGTTPKKIVDWISFSWKIDGNVASVSIVFQSAIDGVIDNLIGFPGFENMELPSGLVGVDENGSVIDLSTSFNVMGGGNAILQGFTIAAQTDAGAAGVEPANGVPEPGSLALLGLGLGLLRLRRFVATQQR